MLSTQGNKRGRKEYIKKCKDKHAGKVPREIRKQRIKELLLRSQE